MAFPWLAVLQSVPWGEVVKNAPRVADGAKKLWNAVNREHPSGPEATGGSPQAVDSHTQTLTELRAGIATLESRTAALQEQMLASSELIKTLADQNAQLVLRIEANRAKVVWLAIACAILGLTAVAALILAL